MWHYATQPVVIIALLMLVFGVTFLFYGAVVLHDLDQGLSRAVSEAGVGLIAAAVVTFVAEPLAHHRLTDAMTRLLDTHDQYVMQKRMAPAVFLEVNSSIIEQHFRRTGFVYNVTLQGPVSNPQLTFGEFVYIKKTQQVSYYVFNLERGKVPYPVRATEELYNRFVFLHGSRIIGVEVTELDTSKFGSGEELADLTPEQLATCPDYPPMFLADENQVRSRMQFQDYLTSVVFETTFDVAGHTWLRVTVRTTGYFAERGSSPFVVTQASDGLTLRVTAPRGIYVETSALCNTDKQFPFEDGHSTTTADGNITKEWVVSRGLLPNQGLELMWYPAEEHKKWLVRRVFYHIWNKGRYDLIPRFVAPDYWITESGSGGQKHIGQEALRQLMEVYRSAFKDLQFSIEDQQVEGDIVTTTWQASGTHTGEFHGIAATNRDISDGVRGSSKSCIDEAKKQVLWERVTWNFDKLLDVLRAE